MADDTAAAPETTPENNSLLQSTDSTNDDKDLEQLKKRLAELEESLKLTEANGGALSSSAGEDAAGNERDRRSVFVGNVHFKTVPQDLQEHFKDCGEINQITILVDKHTGQPKGFAYVEFEKEESVAKAMAMNGSMLHARPIKVTSKRTNVPRFQLRQMYPPAYRGGYGRPPRGGGFAGPYYRPRGRGRHFHPYM